MTALKTHIPIIWIGKVFWALIIDLFVIFFLCTHLAFSRTEKWYELVAKPITPRATPLLFSEVQAVTRSVWLTRKPVLVCAIAAFLRVPLPPSAACISSQPVKITGCWKKFHFEIFLKTNLRIIVRWHWYVL